MTACSTFLFGSVTQATIHFLQNSLDQAGAEYTRILSGYLGRYVLK